MSTGSDSRAKKDDRLQMRIDPELKEWFRQYSDPQGGMSLVLSRLLRSLKEEVKDGGPERGV